MNKSKIVVALCAAAVAGLTVAAPGNGPKGSGGGHQKRGASDCRVSDRPAAHHQGPHHPGPHTPPPPRHHGGWGRGGENFWTGVAGGVVGGVIGSAIAQPQSVVVSTPAVVSTPTVVTTPLAVQTVTPVQNVWVEGRYIDQIQPNGTVIRSWQPGHYEQR